MRISEIYTKVQQFGTELSKAKSDLDLAIVNEAESENINILNERYLEAYRNMRDFLDSEATIEPQ